MNSIESRMNELEEQNAHLQHELDQLNQVVTEMNLEQVNLLKKIAFLGNKITELAEASQSQSNHNPHLGANR